MAGRMTGTEPRWERDEDGHARDNRGNRERRAKGRGQGKAMGERKWKEMKSELKGKKVKAMKTRHG